MHLHYILENFIADFLNGQVNRMGKNSFQIPVKYIYFIERNMQVRCLWWFFGSVGRNHTCKNYVLYVVSVITNCSLSAIKMINIRKKRKGTFPLIYNKLTIDVQQYQRKHCASFVCQKQNIGKHFRKNHNV